MPAFRRKVNPPFVRSITIHSFPQHAMSGLLLIERWRNMTFRICTIGCGQIAVGYHGPAYQRYAALHPGVELTACCDIDQSRADEFKNRYGFKRSYHDYRAMLNQEQPDAVCLLVPPEHIAEMSCTILEQGYPLLTEKPPGRNTAEIDRMIAAASQRSTPNQVAFNRRYMPLIVALKQYLGRLQMPIQYIRYDFSRINRRDADFSTTAIHGIDTARYLVGSDYQHVRFHYQEMPELGPQVANILMDCTFTSGATGQLNFCPVTGLVLERATLHASDHTIFLNLPVWNSYDTPGKLQHFQAGKLVYEMGGLQAAESSDEYVVNGFYGENASFFDDLQQGKRPAGDLESGRQSVEIADCIRARQLRVQPVTALTVCCSSNVIS